MNKDNLPDLAKTSSNVSAAPKSEMATMFESIVDMATNPDVDAGKMTAIVELQMKMMDYQKQEQFNKDKIAAILEMPIITKDGAILDKNKNVRSKFSTFEHLYSVVRPILARHNLILTFDADNSERQPTVTPILSHANGHVERGGAMLVPMEKPNNSVTMAQASAMSVTMGKRHTLKATLSIIEDEDDGNARVQYIEKEDWQKTILELGQSAAAKGSDEYTKWFQSCTNMQRGYLVDSKNHAAFKASAEEIDKLNPGASL